MASYVAGKGEFNRDTNYITTRITADGRDGYPVEPGRYRLDRGPRVSVGEPNDHRAAAAGPGTGSLHWFLRPHS